MQNFLKELKRIEINNDERCFNGFFSSEEYTEYLNKLYSNVDITLLMDKNFLIINIMFYRNRRNAVSDRHSPERNPSEDRNP